LAAMNDVFKQSLAVPASEKCYFFTRFQVSALQLFILNN